MSDAKVGSDEQQATELREALSKWVPQTPREYLEGARWSLETVTHLTEYEDEKANRILTAMTFLSALVGVVFAVVIEKCPTSQISQLTERGYRLPAVVVTGVYVLFPLYFLILAVGAVLVILAIKPSFRIPKTWGGAPGSLLFYAMIVKASGKEWADAYTERSGVEVDRQYLKDSIFETYLISQKIRIKLKKLRWGIWLFIVSTILLIGLLPLSVGVISMMGRITPEKTPAAEKLKTEPAKEQNPPQGKTSGMPQSESSDSSPHEDKK